MDFELSALAAGLPMGASFAMAGGFVALREARRRTALNAALHELRRPLQALSFSLGAGREPAGPLESSLDIAVAALERLDHEINGSRGLVETETFFVRPLVEAAVTRWHPVAAAQQRSLRLDWTGGDKALQGSQIALAQAVDNLISNALVHGRGSIAVEATSSGQDFLLSVKDRGRVAVTSPGRLRVWRPGRDRRHGHGLKIVHRLATRHGGSFNLVRGRSGTEARLVLPLSGRNA